MVAIKVNYRDGAKFAAVYVGIIGISLISILSLLLIFVTFILDASVKIPVGAIMGTTVGIMGQFVILSILAFLAGCCPSGSKHRMIVMSMKSLLTVFMIFYVSHTLLYDLENIFFGSEYGLYISGMKISIDIGKLSMILSVIPIITMIDSVIEYRQNRDFVSV